MTDRPTLWEIKWLSTGDVLENEWSPFMPLRGKIDLAEVISIYEAQGYQCSCVGELVHAQREVRWKGYTTAPDTLGGVRDRALLLVGFACVLRRNEELESWFGDGGHRASTHPRIDK